MPKNRHVIICAGWYLTPHGTWTQDSNLADTFTHSQVNSKIARQLANVLCDSVVIANSGNIASTPRLMRLMNQTNDVVTQDFQEGFIGLSDRRLAPHAVTELPLNGTEGRFDVRPLVVSRKEDVALELEEVEQAIPRLGLRRANRVRLERNDALPKK